MSEALASRLDKIENEIKVLMMLQKKSEKKYHGDCIPAEHKKYQKRRPKSAVDVTRKMAQQKKRKTSKRRSASSTGISRHSSSSPAATRSPSPFSPSPPYSPSKGSPVRKRRSSQKSRSRSRDLEKRSSKQEKKHSKLVFKKDEPDSCAACCKGKKKETCCGQIEKKETQDEFAKVKVLEEEVTNLKELVKELNSTRHTALTVCQQWRDKYNDLKSHQCCCKQIYKEYTAEKAQLTAALEAERTKLKRAMDDLQESEKQLDGYTLACKKYEELLSATKAKNKHFNNMDDENRTLQNMCDGYKYELDMMKEKYEQLQITNQTFAKDVLNRCKSFESSTANAETNLQKLKAENEKLQANMAEMAEMKKASDLKAKKEYETSKSLKSEIEKLHNTINTIQSENVVKNNEIFDLKTQIAESSQIPEEMHYEVSKLRNEISRLSKENEEYEREIVGLHEYREQFMDNMDANELYRMDTGTQIDEKMKNTECSCATLFEKERTTLTQKISELQNDSMEKEKCITERCKNLECKLEQTTALLNETEERFVAENKELRSLAEHLTNVILKQKNRIQEMADLSEKHKELVDAQAKEVECKSCELYRVEDELEEVKRKYEESEKNLMELSSAMETDALMNNMEREIEALNKLLEDETHKLHIKEKIIEDQSNSISQMKKRMCENDDRVALLYKEINLHKKDKNELNVKISQLSEEKKCLTEDCNRSHIDLERQQGIITNLERKMILQNREWELHMEMQVREKEKAIIAAQFASEKLMETIHDFQKQTECQNQVRNMLATMLQDKDDKLRSAILEISSLTYDPEMGACKAKNCDLINATKGRNETSDSNESFSSCRGPEMLSSPMPCHPSGNGYNPSMWYQVYPASQTEEEVSDETVEDVSARQACHCPNSASYEPRGPNLQSQMAYLQCGCINICRCGAESRKQPLYLN